MISKLLEIYRESGNLTPAVYVGSTIIARQCADYWHNNRPVYGISIVNSSNILNKNWTIRDLGDKYATAIADTIITDEVIIISYCLDQIAAYETCIALERRGIKASSLILIDFPWLGKAKISFKNFPQRLLFIFTRPYIIALKAYFKFFGKIAVHHSDDNLDFYQNEYTEKCWNYKSSNLDCNVLLLHSLENFAVKLPDFYLFNNKKIR